MTETVTENVNTASPSPAAALTPTPWVRGRDSAAETVGQLVNKSPKGETDVFVSRFMDIQEFTPVPLWIDHFWLREGGEAVCYFRLTPARWVDIAQRHRQRKAALTAVESLPVPANGKEDRARIIAEQRAVLDRTGPLVRQMRDWIRRRYPELETGPHPAPEPLLDPPMAADCWAARPPVASRIVAATRSPVWDSPAAVHLIDWAKSHGAEALPDGPFSLNQHTTVDDPAAWLARLLKQVDLAADGNPVPLAALGRLRWLRDRAAASAHRS